MSAMPIWRLTDPSSTVSGPEYSIAAPAMDFDAGFVLTDENVFGERRQGAIDEKLLPPVRCFGAGRKHLDHEHRIFHSHRIQIDRLRTAGIRLRKRARIRADVEWGAGWSRGPCGLPLESGSGTAPPGKLLLDLLIRERVHQLDSWEPPEVVVGGRNLAPVLDRERC
jgi:hypothetical protein